MHQLLPSCFSKIFPEFGFAQNGLAKPGNHGTKDISHFVEMHFSSKRFFFNLSMPHYLSCWLRLWGPEVPGDKFLVLV